jgi:hypothetical protein
MSAFDWTFEQLLREKVKETRDRAIEDIARGSINWDYYNKKVGYIQALDDVLNLADEIRKALSQ